MGRRLDGKIEENLTIVYYTGNASDRPFFGKVREQLKIAAGEIQIVSVSQKPMDFGKNICVGEIGRTHLNIYRQILIGAKEAKTKFVALAEDDVLFQREHFTECPFEDGCFMYDMNRWNIYTWSVPPIYSLKNRHTNVTLIAPRELLIEALEERFAKYPKDEEVPLEYWAEPGRYEKLLGVTPRKIREYTSTGATVVFTHLDSMGYEMQGKGKRLGLIRAYDIPYWGKAQDLINKFYL